MRKDGVRVKGADPMYTVAPYIMDKRYDAMNMITLDIPAEPMKNYLNEKRKEGVNISHLALFLAAYTRTIAEFPSLNRFIVNKKIYARNEIAVGMVVLKGGKKLIKVLLSAPGVLNIGVRIFKFMDKYGLLPRSIIEASPFHTTFVVSNLASIRTNHIYHHCYEFGTTSVIMTMGNAREVAKRKGGEIKFEKCIPLGVVMDERICSGSYFALAFRKFRNYLEDPTTLEGPPKVLNVEVEKVKKGKFKFIRNAEATSAETEEEVATV